MSKRNWRVCPVELAGGLDNKIRRWLHHPQKIVGPYLQQGMTVLDIGCGPGFFSIDIAQMVGKSGRVIAADLQEGMLQKLKAKIQGTELEARITLHKCGEKRIGWSEPVDFILAFYMVHELPDQAAFFHEIGAIIKPQGQILIVEPPFHVSKTAFEAMMGTARDAGFIPVERPKMLLDKAVLLQRGKAEL